MSRSVFGNFKYRNWYSLVPSTKSLPEFRYKLSDSKEKPPTPCLINPKIKKDSKKIVKETIDVEEIVAEKTFFCRCWRSETWPYCDGAHSKYNKETGDNVGPLIITKIKK